MGLSGGDHNLAGWATDHTPLFGSHGGAARASDDLPAALAAVCVLSAVTTPGGRGSREWAINKAKIGLVEAGAVAANGAVTVVAKRAANRERPDAGDRESFPSGHASGAGVLAALASRNLEQTPIPRSVNLGLRVGLDALVAATGWARVEAGRHYPTDVLVGAALGHFVGAFVSEAFLRPDGPVRLSVEIGMVGDGSRASVSWVF